ncbi:Small, acid-soluble spore protein, alpha/beta type [Marvinbryantia formatexigens DSM 14469]|uniref:Small, acid-soluble spore protein, alpha/beta type n=2 Tax=Marvinbryantia TaxID=248744 RepID=C6LES2_9FIRM|nr:Small, acid-soluble spore protein, alpha/beta type [Marvinbryantia formatexigens DSM 14469]
MDVFSYAKTVLRPLSAVTYEKRFFYINCQFIFRRISYTITAIEKHTKKQTKRLQIKCKGGVNFMSSKSSNTAAVPEAKGALDRFKFEVASELGVPLTDGYNGNLTSRQNGSVGGYMVKKMIEAQEKQMSAQNGTTML